MSRVLSANVADATVAADYANVTTGIAKYPVEHAVEVRDPGPKVSGLGAGLPDRDVTVALTFSAVVRDARTPARLLPAWDDLEDELRGIVESGPTYRLES